MSQRIPITVANGDGIGPEIMAATLRILEASEAPLEIETIDIGEKVYLAGNSSGIEPSSWESLRRTKVFLKAPITTPQGGGYKSLNVTVRKVLGLYANVRPCVSYHPFVDTKHPVMDVVIVRENEEVLYAGIEHLRPGERLGDVGAAVQRVAESEGFSVVRDFVGHGIGRALHEEPQVPNYGTPGRGRALKPGMVIAIEPMVNVGAPGVRVLDDGWTAVTADGRRSAHFEHTVAVTSNGPEILTRA